MQDLSDKEKKRLERLKKHLENKDFSTVENFIEIEEKVEKLEAKIDKGLKDISEEIKKKVFDESTYEIDPDDVRGEDGEQGPKGDQGEQGPKGDTGERGPKGEDGKNGENGKDGKDGEDGKDGQNGSPDTREQIREKLESFEGEERFDIKFVKGTEIFLTQNSLDRAIEILDKRTQFLINKQFSTVSQTPWTSDINGGNHSLSNINNLSVNGSSVFGTSPSVTETKNTSASFTTTHLPLKNTISGTGIYYGSNITFTDNGNGYLMFGGTNFAMIDYATGYVTSFGYQLNTITYNYLLNGLVTVNDFILKKMPAVGYVLICNDSYGNAVWGPTPMPAVATFTTVNTTTLNTTDINATGLSTLNNVIANTIKGTSYALGQTGGSAGENGGASPFGAVGAYGTPVSNGNPGWGYSNNTIDYVIWGYSDVGGVRYFSTQATFSVTDDGMDYYYYDLNWTDNGQNTGFIVQSYNHYINDYIDPALAYSWQDVGLVTNFQDQGNGTVNWGTLANSGTPTITNYTLYPSYSAITYFIWAYRDDINGQTVFSLPTQVDVTEQNGTEYNNSVAWSAVTGATGYFVQVNSPYGVYYYKTTSTSFVDTWNVSNTSALTTTNTAYQPIDFKNSDFVRVNSIGNAISNPISAGTGINEGSGSVYANQRIDYLVYGYKVDTAGNRVYTPGVATFGENYSGNNFTVGVGGSSISPDVTGYLIYNTTYNYWILGNTTDDGTFAGWTAGAPTVTPIGLFSIPFAVNSPISTPLQVNGKLSLYGGLASYTYGASDIQFFQNAGGNSSFWFDCPGNPSDNVPLFRISYGGGYADFFKMYRQGPNMYFYLGGIATANAFNITNALNAGSVATGALTNTTQSSNSLTTKAITTTSLITPTGTVTPQVAGATTYTYKIVALDAAGNASPSAAITITNGYASLNSTHKNAIALTSSNSNVASYDIYRVTGGATQGKIANVPINFSPYQDSGAAGNGATAPTVNTTGLVNLGNDGSAPTSTTTIVGWQKLKANGTVYWTPLYQ